MGNKAHIKIDEEKQLLLKDLCARLPYHLRGKSKDGKFYEATVIYDTGTILASEVDGVNTNICCGFKPYLRPMSSMTEEDDARRCAFLDDIEGGVEDAIPNYIDWLNANHFDYRGLIPMGLALEAPERMYET